MNELKYSKRTDPWVPVGHPMKMAEPSWVLPYLATAHTG